MLNFRLDNAVGYLTLQSTQTLATEDEMQSRSGCRVRLQLLAKRVLVHECAEHGEKDSRTGEY